MRTLVYIIFIPALMLLSHCIMAQQSVVHSQYLFNGLVLNPAYAGSHVQLSASLNYRKQWVNFDGAPETATFGIHSTVNRERVGVGLLVTNDKIGSYTNSSVYGSYAYIIKKPRGGVLSLGVQGGFNNFKADFSELRLRADQDPIFNAYFNEIRPNFGGGVYYYNKKMFAGFSVPVILKHTNFFQNSLQQLALPRYYYLTAGKMISLDRMDKFKVSPSFLLRMQDGTPLSLDLNVNLIFYDLISFGASYRTVDAIVTFMDFKLSEKFHFTYSYDWTTSALNQYSRGSHEFGINFRTPIRGIHKDLECPFYFSH